MATELEQLAAENDLLRARVRALEEKINFLGQHATLSAGIKGETLAARFTGGTTTPHTMPHDIAASGETIEVKYAKLSRPVQGRPTLRWQWNKIYGERGGKAYTSLLLIGEADPRFREDYLDPDSPYVLFLIPFSEARSLCIKGNPLMMTLSSNPAASRGSSASLWTRWQTTVTQVEERYGVPLLT
jgi:hypothetical protein